MFNRMNNLVSLTSETPYRQLTGVDRAFVDSFVAAIEERSQRTGRDLMDIANNIDLATLTDREREFLSRQLVRWAITERLTYLLNNQFMTYGEWRKRIEMIARTGINDFYDVESGQFRLDIATPEQRNALAKVKITENIMKGTITTEIETRDPMPALKKVEQLNGWETGANNVSPDSAVVSDLSGTALAENYSSTLNG